MTEYSEDEMFKDYNEELNDVLTTPDDWFREHSYTHIELLNLLNGMKWNTIIYLSFDLC